MPSPDSPVHRYHDGTKHHFNRFARSLGYLDWASQPRPFRSFSGARAEALYPSPPAASGSYAAIPAPYDRLFDDSLEPQPLTLHAVGDLLRHALGLSAWKQFGASRWSLRVNPSSGNLHPTEAYVICGPLAGLSDHAGVYHYAADAHALEQRCEFDARAWTLATDGGDALMVALTSIHWREAWKYGERAFRYCQHDLGHAVAAVTFAAGMLGWRAAMVPSWSQRDIATLTGIDRDEDFVDAEREDAGCLIALTAGHVPMPIAQGAAALCGVVRAGKWSGHASQLSEDHVQWTFIDEIARATEDPGRVDAARLARPAHPTRPADPAHPARPARDFREVALRRRSAVAFDSISSLDTAAFFGMLTRLMPGPHTPWTSMWWTPRIHLLFFVHRVDGVPPGLYLLGREPGSADRLHQSIRAELLRDPAHDRLPFICLARGDSRAMARRLSCDQDIASDGYFSLGMIADFDGSLAEHGPSFYRQLFWETGVVGQVLYLEAEAARVGATGIGCFYDDPVHDLLGLEGHAFQSLYHFTVGVPVEDRRLTTEPGYKWEKPSL